MNKTTRFIGMILCMVACMCGLCNPLEAGPPDNLTPHYSDSIVSAGYASSLIFGEPVQLRPFPGYSRQYAATDPQEVCTPIERTSSSSEKDSRIPKRQERYPQVGFHSVDFKRGQFVISVGPNVLLEKDADRMLQFLNGPNGLTIRNNIRDNFKL